MGFSFEVGGKSVGLVSITGRLDAQVASDLKPWLQQVLKEGWTTVVVDLGGVPFIDSSGLGALIAGLKSARVAGGDLRIARPVEQVRYMLQVTTLDRVLRPYPTVEEALAGNP